MRKQEGTTNDTQNESEDKGENQDKISDNEKEQKENNETSINYIFSKKQWNWKKDHSKLIFCLFHSCWYNKWWKWS